MSQKPPFPRPELDSAPITFDQYEAYTPEKLELWEGFNPPFASCLLHECLSSLGNLFCTTTY
ncbi:MAG: hypothetical protein EWV49_21710 [Microcystis aeruginosa Ma_QC_Ch_20071001_S25]|uniref:Uncharacterized protein n=5 Tax=Microcystis aeruginosa TaxID=1126 RepID=A0A6H9GBU6_MICAE|nr:MAG: hypothetical protein EWV82_08125 [Microcystis aeruginosa Ma_AC_P_19900807_S299]TRU28929.1 MAG: hypothetical protein EWV81_03715 [Microcystis aeruginosa Ma_SC_T_19800800_S464]TRU43961.1 MAG: hypothetical protein EWV49_21710 [Microcystis aeruginosa Ma_QC_Ch_20071001_S25]TRU50171.1 MAG: hypothetical protein EWV57_10960 [Microcystis aeruginosa Ma_QC_Ch_20071001_S25D]TRU65481.1 MAG: hypothetical protein EWV90_04740 [Microcystis aeruginosa Ma_QC_Ch_20071001_M135]GBL11689.1 hypothetical prote